MSISVWDANGTFGKQTITLSTFVGSHKVVMLVDSGSSHSFISEQLAELAYPLEVRLANGAELLCSHELPCRSWWIQGHTFKTSFKILPLKCYDIILGMDWLEVNSPMEVHWVDKWLSFQQGGNIIKLHGVQSQLQLKGIVNGDQLHALHQQDEIWCVVAVYSLDARDSETSVHPAIQPLLVEYKDLFCEPKGLPPNRSMMHTIPLMAGVTPFRIRPYRYTPFQKDEIERQVAHLLKNEMIQRSCSPFASPVLLVKKKAGDWRLYVDFRRLNAYTIKNKFPIPIVEELFEELGGAQCFTTLDLRSRFHQILVAEEDRYKTAFQTHQGHYEYKVMPYGLTRAPTTFQSMINYILEPLLRKCVVVFIDDILIYSKSLEDHVKHVQQVFQLLREHQFKAKLSKCSFAQTQLKYLGHILSAQGVSTDPDKIADVQNSQVPTSVRNSEASWD
ncbi:hypothetical protein U9M48_040606 [Paspalum notatum var. saurae]|uniref:Reverse transcriptase domain-containing protein n=1 Tax=Paspalum notatum var. saurae TaxID=547442 RepID=A0AAQ3UNE6_PASNO